MDEKCLELIKCLGVLESQTRAYKLTASYAGDEFDRLVGKMSEVFFAPIILLWTSSQKDGPYKLLTSSLTKNERNNLIDLDVFKEFRSKKAGMFQGNQAQTVSLNPQSPLIQQERCIHVELEKPIRKAIQEKPNVSFFGHQVDWYLAMLIHPSTENLTHPKYALIEVLFNSQQSPLRALNNAKVNHEILPYFLSQIRLLFQEAEQLDNFFTFSQSIPPAASYKSDGRTINLDYFKDPYFAANIHMATSVVRSMLVQQVNLLLHSLNVKAEIRLRGVWFISYVPKYLSVLSDYSYPFTEEYELEREDSSFGKLIQLIRGNNQTKQTDYDAAESTEVLEAAMIIAEVLPGIKEIVLHLGKELQVFSPNLQVSETDAKRFIDSLQHDSYEVTWENCKDIWRRALQTFDNNPQQLKRVLFAIHGLLPFKRNSGQGGHALNSPGAISFLSPWSRREGERDPLQSVVVAIERLFDINPSGYRCHVRRFSLFGQQRADVFLFGKELPKQLYHAFASLDDQPILQKLKEAFLLNVLEGVRVKSYEHISHLIVENLYLILNAIACCLFQFEQDSVLKFEKAWSVQRVKTEYIQFEGKKKPYPLYDFKEHEIEELNSTCFLDFDLEEPVVFTIESNDPIFKFYGQRNDVNRPENGFSGHLERYLEEIRRHFDSEDFQHLQVSPRSGILIPLWSSGTTENSPVSDRVLILIFEEPPQTIHLHRLDIYDLISTAYSFKRETDLYAAIFALFGAHTFQQSYIDPISSPIDDLKKIAKESGDERIERYCNELESNKSSQTNFVQYIRRILKAEKIQPSRKKVNLYDEAFGTDGLGLVARCGEAQRRRRRRKFPREYISEYQIIFKYDNLKQCRAELEIDEAYELVVENVLNNLISNAFKHAFEFKDISQAKLPLQVNITYNQEKTDEKYLVLECTDNGIGIGLFDQVRQKLRQIRQDPSNFRLETDRKILGFCSCQIVMGQIGGYIDLIKSERGTTVGIFIPKGDVWDENQNNGYRKSSDTRTR